MTKWLNALPLQVFVTSGLGGMSGAQAKAAVICGCIGVVAEVGCRDNTFRYLLAQDWNFTSPYLRQQYFLKLNKLVLYNIAN